MFGMTCSGGDELKLDTLMNWDSPQIHGGQQILMMNLYLPSPGFVNFKILLAGE